MFSTVERCSTRKPRNGIWVAVEQRFLKRNRKITMLVFSIYPSAMRALTWQAGDRLVLLVGTGEHAGEIILRPAGDGERGNLLRRPSSKRSCLLFSRVLGDSWVLPALSARRSCPVAAWEARDNSLHIVLANDMKRQLAEAQSTMAKNQMGAGNGG